MEDRVAYPGIPLQGKVGGGGGPNIFYDVLFLRFSITPDTRSTTSLPAKYLSQHDESTMFIYDLLLFVCQYLFL